MKYWTFLVLIGSLTGLAQDPALHNLRTLIKPPVYKVGDSRFFENDEYVDVTVQLKIADSTQNIPDQMQTHSSFTETILAVDSSGAPVKVSRLYHKAYTADPIGGLTFTSYHGQTLLFELKDRTWSARFEDGTSVKNPLEALDLVMDVRERFRGWDFYEMALPNTPIKIGDSFKAPPEAVRMLADFVREPGVDLKVREKESEVTLTLESVDESSISFATEGLVVADMIQDGIGIEMAMELGVNESVKLGPFVMETNGVLGTITMKSPESAPVTISGSGTFVLVSRPLKKYPGNGVHTEAVMKASILDSWLDFLRLQYDLLVESTAAELDASIQESFKKSAQAAYNREKARTATVDFLKIGMHRGHEKAFLKLMLDEDLTRLMRLIKRDAVVQPEFKQWSEKLERTEALSKRARVVANILELMELTEWEVAGIIQIPVGFSMQVAKLKGEAVSQDELTGQRSSYREVMASSLQSVHLMTLLYVWRDEPLESLEKLNRAFEEEADGYLEILGHATMVGAQSIADALNK